MCIMNDIIMVKQNGKDIFYLKKMGYTNEKIWVA